MKSKASTPQYRDGWDRTFAGVEKQEELDIETATYRQQFSPERRRPADEQGDLVKSVEGEDGYEMRSSPCAGIPVERDGKTVHSVTGRPWKGPIE